MFLVSQDAIYESDLIFLPPQPRLSYLHLVHLKLELGALLKECFMWIFPQRIEADWLAQTCSQQCNTSRLSLTAYLDVFLRQYSFMTSNTQHRCMQLVCCELAPGMRCTRVQLRVCFMQLRSSCCCNCRHCASTMT